MLVNWTLLEILLYAVFSGFCFASNVLVGLRILIVECGSENDIGVGKGAWQQSESSTDALTATLCLFILVIFLFQFLNKMQWK